MPISRRFIAIAASVLLVHAGALWVLPGALQRPPAPVIMPVVSLSAQGVATTSPSDAKAVPASPPPPVQVRRERSTRSATRPEAEATQAPAAQPASSLAETPSDAWLSAAPAPAPTTAARRADTPAGPPLAAVTVPAGAIAGVELPSSDAAYLQNPRPAYPPLSRRLGEQGKVIVRVFIGTHGQAHKAEIHRSSGYDRLDQAALQTVLKWRYVPGQRGGTPEAMWFNIPLDFVLE